jgi:hypothetical protein
MIHKSEYYPRIIVWRSCSLNKRAYTRTNTCIYTNMHIVEDHSCKNVKICSRILIHSRVCTFQHGDDQSGKVQVARAHSRTRARTHAHMHAYIQTNMHMHILEVRAQARCTYGPFLPTSFSPFFRSDFIFTSVGSSATMLKLQHKSLASQYQLEVIHRYSKIQHKAMSRTR